MGLRRFLRFLNSERGETTVDALLAGRRSGRLPPPPQQQDGTAPITVYRDGRVVSVTDPQIGEMVIDSAGFPIGRYKGVSLLTGQPRIDDLNATEFDQFMRLLGNDGGGGSSFSSSTSFNVSEIGPIAAQIQREELALQERRIRQETAITQLQAQIEIGEIDINTALTQYDQFLTGQRLRLDASEFAVAPGTQFAPGFEPGGIGSQLAESAGLTPSAGVAPITPVTISAGTPPAITPLAESAPIQAAFEQLQQFGL